MSIIQCPNKHFFDDQKFQECPHCKRGLASAGGSGDNTKTIAKYGPTASVTVPAGNSDDDDSSVGRTQSVYFMNNNSNPVSGWLVCTAGENRGRSYETHIGKNFVGRSMRSDVVINDPQISRENHFSLIYDPASSKFFITAGSSLVYLNSERLDSPAELKENDCIQAGSSSFVFVPFCSKERKWDD